MTHDLGDSGPAPISSAFLSRLAAFSAATAEHLRGLPLHNVLPIIPHPTKLDLNQLSWGASGKPAFDVTLFLQVGIERSQTDRFIVESRFIVFTDIKPWLNEESNAPRYTLEYAGDGFQRMRVNGDRLEAALERAMKAPFVQACAKWLASRSFFVDLPEISEGRLR